MTSEARLVAIAEIQYRHQEAKRRLHAAEEAARNQRAEQEENTMSTTEKRALLREAGWHCNQWECWSPQHGESRPPERWSRTPGAEQYTLGEAVKHLSTT